MCKWLVQILVQLLVIYCQYTHLIQQSVLQTKVNIQNEVIYLTIYKYIHAK